MEKNCEKKGYLLEEYRLFHLNDAQGTKMDFHYHGFCKLLLLRTGSGGYTVDGNRYLLDAGDFVLVDSHMVHRPEFESGMPYERTILYISPEFLSKNSSENCNLQDVFSGAWGHVLRADAQMRRQLISLTDKLEKTSLENEYGQEILRRALLLQLLVEIGKNLQSPSFNHPVPVEPTSNRIVELKKFMDAHLEEDLTVDDLAEHFFISKYHMMRQFRQETGTTVYGYLLERRLYLARERIRQGMSATESCFRSGFRSYSSFTRAFYKRFGTTPTGRSERVIKQEETFE